jgi:hypothetical protein
VFFIEILQLDLHYNIFSSDKVRTRKNKRTLFVFFTGFCLQDGGVFITAILGESVVFNCHVEFPDGHPVPYVLQWEKKVGETVGFQPVCSLTVVANGEVLVSGFDT